VEQERLQELIGNLIAPSEVLTMERVPEYSPRAQRLLDNAGKEAQMRRADQAGTEHILLAMLKETESVATRLLYTMGVNIQKLYAAVLAAMGCDQEAIAEEMQASRNLKDKKEQELLFLISTAGILQQWLLMESWTLLWEETGRSDG
jgi:ATPases with chaperone activity, ATP-binding subunit